MKLTTRIVQCQDCKNLKELLKLVDCSLQNVLKNKLNSENYNVETYFSLDLVKSLGHYKRILTRKIYNSDYLSCIDDQDIIFQVRKRLFGDCSTCIKCDTTTTNTTNIINTTTTTFIGGE